MADVNANIGINIDTSQSLAEIKNLQRQLAQLYTSINRGSAAAAAAQKGLATNLMNTVNAGGKFYAQMGTIRTSTESFTHALEKNKLTMREYFRFAGGSTRTFGRLFKSEFDTIGRVAEERVKKMQTQYVKLGRDASGAMRAISITPTSLNMKDYGNQVAVAAQKQAILNQLLRQGSTNLLNFGKNTQWAGRQLMVGFTIPLAYFGTAAAKTFMDLEAQAIKFRRVYGDMFTTTAETNKALADIQALAEEFTKYGVAVSKTMEMAASAAAMGKTGAELTAQVAQATRLAVLGNVEQEQALTTTISLTNAFGLAAEELTGKINFLNAVENQTVTAIEDLTIAIPKAGPVVESLGGSVEDLAFFLTAMREGGINASEGANALKSGLASLINPTDKAAGMLADMGININAIVEGNFGNLRETVIDFAQALDQLAPLERSRAIEQLFGKFQFARLDALFTNVTKEGGQAARVLDLAGKSVEELAILSERELKAVEDAIGTNFRAAVEELKLAIAPIGKEFLKAITPVVKFLGDLFERFNNLSDGSKRFIVILTTLVGLVGPTLLMTFGLVANGAANIIKLFLLMRQGFLKLTGNSTNLAQQTQYLNSEQMEAAVVAASLNQAHTKLTQQFTLEAGAVNQLRNAYVQATAAAARFAATNPGMMVPGAGKIPKKFNSGTMKVPGYSKGTDSVPAMLTPGEAVIPEPIAQDDRFKPLIAALVSGEIAKYEFGTVNVGGKSYSTRSQLAALNLEKRIAQLIASGISEEKIIKALDRNIERGRPMTASALDKRLSLDRGSGKGTSAPSAIKKLARESQSGFRNETKAIKKILQQKGITITPQQEKNLFSVQASHIEEVRNAGVKQWSAANLVADLGYVNNYLNTVKGNLGKNLLAMSDDQLKGLGINREELKSLQSGRHPTTAASAETLRAIARYDASLNPRSYQANAVLAGLEYRSKTGFYARPLRTLADFVKTPATMAVGKGEKIKTKDGKVLTVTGQTGFAKPSTMKVVGGGVSDKRVITGGNIASVFPRGFKGPRLVGLGAQDGYGEGKTTSLGIKSGGAPGVTTTQISQSYQRTLADLDNDTKETAKQTRNLGQKFATGANVFSGLTIMGSFMGGKIGEVSQKLAPFAIGLSTIAMLLPGLKSGLLKFGGFLAANPFVAVGLAIAGIAVAAKLVDEKMKKQARAQSDYIDAISATTEKMKKVGEVTDEVGASQIMQMRRQGATANKFTTGYERAGQQFGTSFLESEVGKDILTNFKNSLAKGGTNAVKQIALELSAYVSDGLMTAEDANSVARSIGINMSNMALAANIQGQLTTILGPNGEDLTKNPLKVRIDIVEQSRNNIKDFANAISEETKKIGAGGEVYDAGFARDMAAAGAASGVQALETLQAQRDAQAIMLEDKIKELEVEKSKTKDKEKQAEIEKQIEGLRSQQATDDAKLAGKRSQIIKDQLALFKESQKVGKNFRGSRGETAFFESAKQQVVTKFEGDPFVKKFLEESAGLDSKELEVQLLTIVGAGDLTPQAAINFINLFGEDEAKLDTVINSKIAIENPDKFAQLQNLVGGLQGKKAKTVGLDIMTKLTAPGEEGAFEDRLAAITLLQKMDGKEINVAAFLEGDVLGKLDKLVPLLNKVEEKKEINVKVLQQLEGETGTDLQGLIDDWEHYVNLPADIQKTATQTYITIYKTIGKKELAAELMNQTGGSQVAANFLGERTSSATVRGQLAARLTKEQFAAGQAPNTIPGVGGGGGGAGKNRDTTLDELLKRLKFIRKASIDAEGGIKELLKITGGKGLEKFGGVMQQLMAGPKGGFNREFISFLEGMDNKTRATYMTIKNGEVVLTKQGKALKEAFNEKVIGEYQVANRQALQDTKAQGAALLKLQAAGVDSATALEMVADANLAVAINSKNISSVELLNMEKNAKAAKDAINQLNLALKQESLSSTEKLADSKTTLDVLKKIRQIQPAISQDIMDYVASNPQFAKSLSEAFNGAKNNLTEIQNIINNIPEQKKVNIEISMTTNPIEEISKQINEIGGKMSAYFSNKRDVISAPFIAQMEPFDEIIRNLAPGIAQAEINLSKSQDALKVFTDQIDGIESQISAKRLDLETGIEQEIKKQENIIKNLNEQIKNQFEKPIKALQDAIKVKEREIEFAFDRPIEVLQEESSDLANELTLMDRVVDGINKKYDEQAAALQKVSDINQDILNQQKSQLDIASAITQGDISAAARAAQEARAQSAAAASQRAGGVLDAARQAEIAAVRSPGGLTRAQIEERQFQISQQIFALEEQREIKQLEIRDIQDQIYNIEVAREQFINNTLLPAEEKLTSLQNTRLLKLEEIEKLELDILKIKQSPEYKKAIADVEAAEKRLDELNKKVKDAQLEKAKIEADLLKALSSVEKQEAEWKKIETAIAAAKLSTFNYGEELKKAEDLASKLATSIIGIGNADKGLVLGNAGAELGTSTTTGLDSFGLNPKDPDYAEKRKARGLSTGSSGAKTGSSLTKTIADTLKASEGSAKIVKEALGKIAEFSNLSAADQQKIADAIVKQAESLQVVEPIQKAMPELLVAQLESTTTISTLYEKTAAAVKNVFDQLNKLTEKTGILERKIELLDLIKQIYDQISKTVDGYIESLRQALSVAQEILSTILKLNTTVKTTHIIETIEYVTKVYTAANGGLVPGYMGGGKVRKMYMAAGGAVGSDTVPAMLTPGEYVVNRASSRAFAPFLSAINESKYPSILARNISESRPIYQIPIQTSLSQPSYEISTPSFVASPTNIANAAYNDNSSAVYNYNVGISVGGTSASPDSIAKAVMNEIKYLDSQRVRNQKVS